MADANPLVDAVARHSDMLAELVEVIAWLEARVEHLERQEDTGDE